MTISIAVETMKDVLAVAQMMAENREGLGMKVLAVMVQRYGVLPKEMWDLNSVSDMEAGRRIKYSKELSEATFKDIINNNRYSIIHLIIGKDVSHKVELPATLRKLEILAKEYNFPLDLPDALQELSFDRYCAYNQLLVLPKPVRKLVLNDRYNQPITLPPGLVELDLGREYSQPLGLPQALKRLSFERFSRFNLPVALPPSLVCMCFGMSYNQPTILPSGVVELGIGWAFSHDVTLPTSLRKIEWCCNRPIQIPEGVSEVKFHGLFNQPVVLPVSLKKAVFLARVYSHAISLPTDLEELDWRPEDYVDLVLPERLRKLTWESHRPVTLPSGLRELTINADAPLELPEGLLEVTFNCSSQRHHNLPESVQEVTFWSSSIAITHPTILQHLRLKSRSVNVDLSGCKINKLTIEFCGARIKTWPQGLKELEFTVDDMDHPLRVPKGCTIVGEKRPLNVIME